MTEDLNLGGRIHLLLHLTCRPILGRRPRRSVASRTFHLTCRDANGPPPTPGGCDRSGSARNITICRHDRTSFEESTVTKRKGFGTMRSTAPPESSPYPQLQMWFGRKRSLPPTWDESPPSLWPIEYDSYCSMAHQYQMHILAILLIILVNIYTSVRTFLCVHLNSTELSSLMSSTIDLISHITGQEPEILRERF